MKIPTIFTVVAGIVVAVNAAPKSAPDKTTTSQQAAEIYIFTDPNCTAAVGGVHINAGGCYVISQPSFAVISMDKAVGDTANCTGNYIPLKPNGDEYMLTIRSEQPYGPRLL